MKRREYPLAWCQKGFVYFYQQDPEGNYFNISTEVYFHEKSSILDKTYLTAALQDMVDRHDILRTVFRLESGTPRQVVLPDLKIELQYRNVAADNLNSEIEDHLHLPFDLTKGPLIRFYLISHADDKKVLQIVVHHIIFDGASFTIFIKELRRFYLAHKNSVREEMAPALSYQNFVEWEQQILASSRKPRSRQYWHEQFKDGFSKLVLPADRPRSAVRKGGILPFKLDPAIIEKMDTCAFSGKYGLHTLLLGAFTIMLHRYSQQQNAAIALVTKGRPNYFRESLGHFVNPVPFKIDCHSESTVMEHLAQTQKTVLGALKNQEYPFMLLMEELQAGQGSTGPIVPIVFNFIPEQLLKLSDSNDYDWGGVKMVAIESDQPPIAGVQYDLHLKIKQRNGELTCYFDYDKGLFSEKIVSGMSRHFSNILSAMLSDPGRPLGKLEMLTSKERKQILHDWNVTRPDYPDNTCLHHLFEKMAEEHPDKLAVVSGKNYLTYHELNIRSNQLSHYLISSGIRPETMVGVHMERSLEMVTAIMAVLKAGGAYVPIDPAYPRERIDYMVRDSNIKILLTKRDINAGLSIDHAKMIYLDTDIDLIESFSSENPDTTVASKNLAYVIYTSGSTGKPKGVMIEHQNAVAFLYGAEQLGRRKEHLSGTSVASFCFDANVWEFFMNLCFGGTLHILDTRLFITANTLVDYFADNHITSAYIPPGILIPVIKELESRGPASFSLDRLLVGVEPLLQSTLQRLRDLFPHIRIINIYGPTEATVGTTLYKFDSAVVPDKITPIGKPVAGYKVYVVDKNFNPVPVNVPGELCVAGAGVGRGYLGLPERTAQSFISNPFDPDPNSRLYKTGDFVKWLADGNIEFVGRRDHQVKIRGFRVEPREIEYCLYDHPKLREVAVTAKEIGKEKKIIAYFIPFKDKIETEELKTFLRKSLPEYMIPEFFIEMEAFPTTPNGKLDRKALPVPDINHLRKKAFAAPQNDMEHNLVRIFSDQLGLERISVVDGFFEIGVSSITIIELIAEIKNKTGMALKPTDFFEYPTISSLSGFLLSGGDTEKKNN